MASFSGCSTLMSLLIMPESLAQCRSAVSSSPPRLVPHSGNEIPLRVRSLGKAARRRTGFVVAPPPALRWQRTVTRRWRRSSARGFFRASQRRSAASSRARPRALLSRAITADKGCCRLRRLWLQPPSCTYSSGVERIFALDPHLGICLRIC